MSKSKSKSKRAKDAADAELQRIYLTTGPVERQVIREAAKDAVSGVWKAVPDSDRGAQMLAWAEDRRDQLAAAEVSS